MSDVVIAGPSRRIAFPVFVLLCGLVAGCANLTGSGNWGAAAGWPDGRQLVSSAALAARSVHTWLPAAGALVFGTTGLDHDIADYAADHTPLFGGHASDASDTLRDVALASYLVSAIAAPSDSIGSRARGLLIGGTTLLADRALVDAIKQTTGRPRPDGSNTRSFPSGHTSLASTSATMTVSNLAYIEMPDWTRRTLDVAAYGTAAATGWARVEAEKHYPSDVLAGYALGSFLARFAYDAFLQARRAPPLDVDVAPLRGGASITVSMILY